MKKFLLITLLSLSSCALATPIEIKITNHGNVTDSKNVKIKLSNQDGWINIGPMYLGENKFDIDADVDGSIGTILFESNENRVFAAHFSKDESMSAIHFEIKKPNFTSDEDSISNISYSFPMEKNNNVNFMSNIYQLPTGTNEAWFEKCDDAVKANGFSCGKMQPHK